MAQQYDNSFLQAALIGFTAERERVQQAILELEKQLSGRTRASVPGANAKRKLSPAARKRIADAQKKRWAAYHEQETPPAAKLKRKLSAAARAKLVANLAKARAAKAAQ